MTAGYFDLVDDGLVTGVYPDRLEVRPLFERRASVQFHLGIARAAHAATHQLVEAGLIERGLVRPSFDDTDSDCLTYDLAFGLVGAPQGDVK